MKIVITNVYCYKNKGDAGIVVSMIQNLKKTFNNPEIKLVSLYPEEDEGKYDKDVTILPPIIKTRSNTNKYMLALQRLSVLFIKKMQYSLGIFNNETEKSIKEADLIISCGGGYMQSHGFKKTLTDYIHHYLQLLCANSSKNNFVIFAQTIGPFESFAKFISKKILKNAKMVLVREKRSYDYVEKNFKNVNLHLTSDAAFMLESSPVEFKKEDGKLAIGLTVRKWIYPGSSNPDEKNKNFVNSISKFIDYAINKYNSHIYIMPQCIGPDPDNDIIISKEIYDNVENKEDCSLLTEDFTPGQLKSVYKQMDYFIGTRMHSNIFSLAELVPCLAISYDYKTDGIMNLFDLDEYVININKLELEELKEKFEKLVNDTDVKIKIKDKLSGIQDDSAKNYEMIKNIFESEV